MKIKSYEASRFTSRRLVMPDQINPNGYLFGGILLSWIDKVAYMSAQRHAERNHVVTASIHSVEFFKPMFVGEHVLLTSTIYEVGRTSMKIKVQVEKEEPCTGERVPAASAHLVFVALDENQRPTPVPLLEMPSVVARTA